MSSRQRARVVFHSCHETECTPPLPACSPTFASPSQAYSIRAWTGIGEVRSSHAGKPKVFHIFPRFSAPQTVSKFGTMPKEARAATRCWCARAQLLPSRSADSKRCNRAKAPSTIGDNGPTRECECAAAHKKRRQVGSEHRHQTVITARMFRAEH